MERALDLQPADRDLQIAIGNAYFDQGYLNKDNAGLERSREFYRKALASKPGDADVRTDLALSFFLFDPPDYASAVAEFEKALASNPKQERGPSVPHANLHKTERHGKGCCHARKT